MPTAVITESSEKTMSTTMICATTAASDLAARPRAVVAVLLTFELAMDLIRRLGDEKQSADEQDEIAARDAVAEHAEQRRCELHDPGDAQ